MAGLCVLLGFHGIFRTGEIFAMRWGHFTFHQGQRAFSVTLLLSKSGQRKGVIENVVVEDPLLCELFPRIATDKLPGISVLDMPPARFRHMFALEAADLSFDTNTKPYSMRRGGACYHFSLHGSLDKTMETDRWNSQRAARICINTALLEQSSHNVPLDVQRRWSCLAALWRPAAPA